MSQADQSAEFTARLKEAIDDKTESLKRAVKKLLCDMQAEQRQAITVKTPSGCVYYFEVENRGERVKITKPK